MAWYHDLKPGDVIEWRTSVDDDEWLFAIVADPPVSVRNINFTMWSIGRDPIDRITSWQPRQFREGYPSVGSIEIKDCRPYDGDHDAVWAALSAALLLGKSN